MGKHTKFGSSDDESDKERKDKKNDRSSHKKEKKDKPDRDEARREEKKHHKHRETDRDRSPRESRQSHKDIKKRDEYRDQRRERDREHRDHYKHDIYQREDRGDRRRDYNNRNNQNQQDRRGNREPEKKRLTEEEIKAQRNALWGNKKTESADQSLNDSDAATSAPVAKNEKLWSSAIAATGVDSSKANKFMRLMGVKSGAKTEDAGGQLSDEKERQTKMMTDLEKQYAIARETTHMGRGNGLGFH